jgi:hypothetical protein
VSNFTPADREPARTDAQAKSRFLEVLGRSLSTVSKTAVWRVGPVGEEFAAFTVPETLRLSMSDESDCVYLRSTMRFTYEDDRRFEGERKVATSLYAHTAAHRQDLSPELYSWEWAASEPTYPHLHVRRSDMDFGGLGKFHIPTGRVFFEDVLTFLIREHFVQPVRDDWEAVLTESHRRVSTFATWGGRRQPT